MSPATTLVCRAVVASWLLLVCSCGSEVRPPPPPPDPPVEIDELARPMVDDGWTVGMVIGILRPDGSTETYAYGSVEAGGAAPTASTLFEIGSISKTFTSLALADMVSEGTVTLDQPVQGLLPAGEVTVPAGAVPITLAHLATHTSGLPRMPDNMNPADPQNPYVDYTAQDMYDFLDSHVLTASPGERYEYSNLAVGLLGHALARTDGVSWEEHIAARITEPLGLADTVMTLSPDRAQRFARGHDADLGAVRSWEFDALAGAGALRSTATDMLAYLAAQAGVVETDLAAAIESTHEGRYTISAGREIGLAWVIHDARYVWHNGGTAGFGTFVGLDLQTRAAVTVLFNTSGGHSAETLLGLELLELVAGEAYATPELPPTLTLPEAELVRYAGRFVMGADAFDVVLRDGALFLEIPGQSPFRMYASAVDEFYLRVAAVLLSYGCDASGCNTITVEAPGAAPVTAMRAL